MKVIFFLLGLAHVLILFASAIALSVFILVRLTKWLWRISTRRSRARKPVKRPQKKYLSPVSETPLH